MQKQLLSIAAILAFVVAIVSNAQAVPISPSKSIYKTQVTFVADGCGRGWHRGPAGHCRRN